MSNVIDKIRLSGVTYDLPSGGSGSTTVELTQAEYDALVSGGTVDPDTYYIITDATPQDMSQYWTSAQTSSAITEAVSGKQDTLIAGDNITISGNVISASGGGGSITIDPSLDSGSTNAVANSAITNAINAKQDAILGLWSESPYRSVSIGYNNDNTVRCNSSLAVGSYNTIGSGTRSSIAVGENNTVGGDLTKYGMYAFGGYCNPTNNYSLASGYYVKTDNIYEAGFGAYNKTTFDYTKPFGDSGNTLFSVGNGTADNARHNAFEIKQNGDIYISSGGTDIKLQDHLGGGGISSGEVQSMIDESVSGKQDTLSAGTNITITDNVISAQLEGGTVSRGDVEDMIEEATSGLQETLSAGTGIEIDSANTISCTVSGKTYSAGTNISIDANDAINCTLPITATTKGSYKFGTYNTVEDCYQFWSIGSFNTLQKGSGYENDQTQFVYGLSNNIKGAKNFIFGYLNQTDSNNTSFLTNTYTVGRNNQFKASGGAQSNVYLIGYENNNGNKSKVFAFGRDNTFNNVDEYTVGRYNNSVSDGTTSGNTFFSIGNGTANNARHNAFEIRQNGDIYITSGGTDIKLQDHLGGGGGMDADMEQLIATSLVDLNDRKIDASEVRENYQLKGDYATKSELATKANVSDVMTLEKAKENERVTAFALNDLNNKFGGLKIVKITQSEYTALTNKDENTLYVVVADQS